MVKGLVHFKKKNICS